MEESLTGKIRQAAESHYLWRNVLAIIGIASFTLAWVKLDGAASSMSGSGLIAYLISGNERWEMLKAAPIGALSLMLAPVAALIAATISWWKAWNDRGSVGSNIAAILAPIPILIFAGSITSSENLMTRGIMAPQTGVIILILSQIGMIALEAMMRNGKKLPWAKETRGRTNPAPRQRSQPAPPEARRQGGISTRQGSIPRRKPRRPGSGQDRKPRGMTQEQLNSALAEILANNPESDPPAPPKHGGNSRNWTDTAEEGAANRPEGTAKRTP